MQIILTDYFALHTPVDLFIQLIKAQYKIRWNTSDGQYVPFNFFDLPEEFQKHRLYNCWLQTKLYESRTLIEMREGDFSDFLIPTFCRVKVLKGKRAKSSRRRNRSYQPSNYMWKSDSGATEEFPVKWLPPKLKTVVKKHCAEYSSMDYSLLRHLDERGFSDEDEDDQPDDDEDDENFGVYLLILENENCPQKCQLYFGWYEQNVEMAIKEHEKNISEIAVQMCSTENFRYNSEWKTIDILLLLSLLHKREMVCFRVANGFSVDRDVVGIVLRAAKSETLLDIGKNDSIHLWGPPVQPKYGVNSRLELEELKRSYRPTSFPGSQR